MITLDGRKSRKSAGIAVIMIKERYLFQDCQGRTVQVQAAALQAASLQAVRQAAAALPAVLAVALQAAAVQAATGRQCVSRVQFIRISRHNFKELHQLTSKQDNKVIIITLFLSI
jgi:hypothetical protein